MLGQRRAPLVLAFLICLQWLSAAQGVEPGFDPIEQKANALEETFFSWEGLLNNSLSLQEFHNASGENQDFIQVQHFLASFGKALDHCNLKIEESAEVSRHLIRRYMETVIANRNSDGLAEVDESSYDPLAEIDIEEKILDLPEDIIADPIVPKSHDLWGSLSEVLETLREACDDLPIAIVESDIETQRNPGRKVETVLEQIIRAMTGWTTEWSNKLRILSSDFIDSCVKLTTCERNLKIIVGVFSKSLEETKQSNMNSNHGLNVHSIIGSSSFWDTMSTYANSNENPLLAGNNRNLVNSVLMSKMQNMAGIFGHFAGAPDNDNEEYINASGANDNGEGPMSNIDVALLEDNVSNQDDPSDLETNDELQDDIRMQRMVAAAVNVIRFPWHDKQPSKATVTIAGDSALRAVPATFLSLALESKLIHSSSEQFDTRSTKLRTMMSYLSPAVFRLGGSSANFLTFAPEGSEPTRDGLLRDHQVSSLDALNPNQNEISLSEITGYQRPSITNVHPRRNPFAANYHKGGNLNRYRYTTTRKTSQIPKTHPKFRQIQAALKSLEIVGESTKSLKIDGTVMHPKFKTNVAKQSGVIDSLPTTYRDNIPRPLAHADASLGTPNRSRRSITSTHPKFIKHRNTLDPWDYNSGRQEARRCFGEPHFTNYTMTGTEFSDLLELCKALNWTLLFDLNQFRRDAEGKWDPANARQIIAAAQQSSADVIWQVGNEPNNYAHKFQFNISGVAMVEDVQRLRREVQGTSVWQRLKEQLGLALDGKVHVVGPDVTRPRLRQGSNDMLDGVGTDSVGFLEDFLSSGPGLVDAISWHQYYVCGRTANTSQFTSPDVMELFTRQLRAVSDVRDRLSPDTPIWITETGSAYGGGAPGLSNRFAGSFLWLDKLGVAARDGVDVVARQSLYGGHYAMLDYNYDPNPDYWVAVLHKLLVGGRVLNATLAGTPDTVRLYAHCIKEGHPLYQAGGAVLFGLNSAAEAAEVALEGAAGEGGMGLQFVLTPALGDLTARDVLLNGFPLSVSEDGGLPPLMPASAPGDKVFIPGNSLGFWLFPAAGLAACQ